MASFVYGPAVKSMMEGGLVLSTGTFKVMLTTSLYAEDKNAHQFRSSVTNEVTGTGYTAGGNTVTVTVGAVTAGTVTVTLGGTTWPSSTITARKAVYYKNVGTAATDNLIAINDFVTDVTTSNATFTLNSSSVNATF